MATSVSLNAVSYSIPAQGEGSWGTAVSSYLIALSTGVLQKAGGTFTLTADADFGASYGLKAMKFSSRTTPSTTGIVRLGNAESVGWRNAANNADLLLTVTSGNLLQFNAVNVLTASSSDTVLSKTFDDSSTYFVDTDDATKKVRALINSAQSGSSSISVTFPSAAGTLATLALAETLTNKTLTEPSIVTDAKFSNEAIAKFYEASGTGTNYIGIKAPAAVTADKTFILPDGDGSANQVLGTDGSLQLQWQTVATDALSQYSVKVGDSGGTAAQVNTNLLGTIAATYSTATTTMTIATPAVVTQAGHGLVTGDRIYFTTTGALPTGVSASTTYYITKVDADTFKLSTTVANLLAGTFVASSGSQSGTHTIYKGGFTNVGSDRRGRFDGTAIASGYIGEKIGGAVGSPVSLTTNTPANGASLSLTPGVWQIFATCYFDGTGSTTWSDSSFLGINTTSATIPADDTVAVVYPTSLKDHALKTSTVVNISATTTYYMVCQATFGASTAAVRAAYSSFYAIRIA